MRIAVAQGTLNSSALHFINNLRALGHDVIEVTAATEHINADFSIVWNGRGNYRDLIERLPKPRALIWNETLVYEGHTDCKVCKGWWKTFCYSADMWDLIFVYWNKIAHYMKQETDVPIIEMPHGSFTLPLVDIQDEKKDRVCLVGKYSRWRKNCVNIILDSGIKIDWYKNQSTYPYVENHYFKLLQQYPIHLNIHRSGQCNGFETRVWDSFATNRLCISEPMSDTEDWVVSGKHYLSIPVESFPPVISYYLENKKERDFVAQQGYSHGRDNTTLIRAADIVSKIKEIQ